jgi:hypothetical protein
MSELGQNTLIYLLLIRNESYDDFHADKLLNIFKFYVYCNNLPQVFVGYFVRIKYSLFTL